jgi:hypothetical protein
MFYKEPNAVRIRITLSKGRRSDLPRAARARGGKAIAAFARMGRIPCHVLPKPGDPKPGAPEFHINNVNAYHSRLKANLEQQIGATSRPSHLLGLIHPPVHQEIGGPFGDRGADPQASTVPLGVIDQPVALPDQIAVQRLQGGPQLS